jgi:phenylacetate-CoA ligase
MRVFDRDRETMRPDLREQVQFERLQALLARLRRNVRRYREQLGDIRIESLADLTKLPLTAPEDLVDAFPYGMFALPLREVARLDSLVGPDGRQLVTGHTANDLKLWGRLTARQLVAAGVTSSDIIQVCFGGGFFSHAFGYMLGAGVVEASVIPEETLHVDYQLQVLSSYRTSALITTPTNAADLMALLRTQHKDPQALQLRTVLLTRPVRPELRHELEAGLCARVCCGFGVSAVMDPGLCVECEAGRLHVNEDCFLAESVGGELVLTTLCHEAMPLLRYRTRVSCGMERMKCDCGRTGIVLTPGERLDGRQRVNEIPLYERQVDQILRQTRAAGQPFRIAISERRVAVAIEVSEDFFGDQMRGLELLRREIQSEFLSRLGIEAEVQYVAPGGADRTA